MISSIAWENISWLKKAFFKRLDEHGGMSIAVDPFKPFLKLGWIRSLKPATARQQFLKEIEVWAEEIRKIPLTIKLKRDHWDREIQFACGSEEYSRLMWFLFRAHYNLYCLSTNRRTIEELALGSYVYASKKIKHTEEIDKAAIADLRRLLRLSNIFLKARWVHAMIDRAIANGDKQFFKAVSNSVKSNNFTNPSSSAIQWLLVILLWFMGGKDYKKRRDFLNELEQHEILPWGFDEYSLNAELKRLGLTRT